jgi:bla regulator protein BlaR1
MIGKIWAVVGLGCGVAMGQASAPKAETNAPKVETSAPKVETPKADAGVAKAATDAKPLAFDIVSIRQNVSQPSVPMMGPPQFGPTADGYRATNMPFVLPILTAYVPSTGGAAFFTEDRVVGLPSWVTQERYDIDAKVSEEDMAEWQKPGSQLAMLQAMLRTMLEDRCKLVVHREVKEVAVYSLVVGKNGPKFKETDPTVEHAGGMKLPWGGVIMPGNGTINMYGVSMASLASFMTGIMNAGRPVQDKTGLTGRYDIVMKPPQMGGGPGDAGGGAGGGGGGIAGPAVADPGSSMMSVIQDQLGLKLVPEKANAETLVIDHMERPSAN